MTGRRVITVMAAVAIALLFFDFLAPTTAVAASASASLSTTTTAAQRQRFNSLAAYAERVGLVLELLVRGYGSSSDKSQLINSADEFVEDVHFDFPLLTRAHGADPTPLLAYVAQFLQYPQNVVRSAIESVAGCMRSIRILTNVVMRAPLDKETEMLLAQMKVELDTGRRSERVRLTSPLPALVGDTDTDLPVTPSMARNAPSIAMALPLNISLSATPRTAENIILITNELVPLRCASGLNAYSSNAVIACRGTLQVYTIEEYMTLTQLETLQCRGVLTGDAAVVSQACVCPRDAFLHFETNIYSCFARPLRLQVALEDRHVCNSEAETALGLPRGMDGVYCITTNRNSTLELPVTWRYEFLMDSAILAETQLLSVYFPPELPPQNGALRWVVMARRQLYIGTYTELSINPMLFNFMVAGYAGAGQPLPSPGDVGFYLSRNTPLSRCSAFDAIFSFASPRKNVEQMRVVPFFRRATMRSYLGDPSGVTHNSLTLDLSSVPNDFLEGNQMYMETGLQSDMQLQPPQVTRIYISFTDIDDPPTNTYKYRRQFNPLYILLIAAVCALVFGIGAAVLWYYCMQPGSVDEHLVSAAQKKKPSFQN